MQIDLKSRLKNIFNALFMPAQPKITISRDAVLRANMRLILRKKHGPDVAGRRDVPLSIKRPELHLTSEQIDVAGRKAMARISSRNHSNHRPQL